MTLILIVILIFAVPAVLHYLVWGWWMTQVREREQEAEGETTADDRR